MTACCAASANARQLSVHACFERGLASMRLPPLTMVGETVTVNGLWAAFTLHIRSGHLQDIRFQASTCTTLIAYCQALADINRGRPCEQADGDSLSLIAALPGIPLAKQDRAVLAAAAFRAALDAATTTSETTEQGAIA